VFWIFKYKIPLCVCVCVCVCVYTWGSSKIKAPPAALFNYGSPLPTSPDGSVMLFSRLGQLLVLHFFIVQVCSNCVSGSIPQLMFTISCQIPNLYHLHLNTSPLLERAQHQGFSHTNLPQHHLQPQPPHPSAFFCVTQSNLPLHCPSTIKHPGGNRPCLWFSWLQ